MIMNSLIKQYIFFYCDKWGLGIGDWGLGPIPNPQSPIPNPQSPIPIIILFLTLKLEIIYNIILSIKFLKK